MSFAHRFNHFLQKLQSYVHRPWYPAAVGVLAGLDHFIIVFPTDGVLITSVLAAPKRWISLTFLVSIGSTLGAVAFAWVFQHYGTGLIDWISPGAQSSTIWKLTDGWFDQFGLWALFACSALPITLHPAVVAAALAGVPLPEIGLAVLAGRVAKYGLFGWLASHAPNLLYRLKPVRKEVEQVISPESPE